MTSFQTWFFEESRDCQLLFSAYKSSMPLIVVRMSDGDWGDQGSNPHWTLKFTRWPWGNQHSAGPYPLVEWSSCFRLWILGSCEVLRGQSCMCTMWPALCPLDLMSCHQIWWRKPSHTSVEGRFTCLSPCGFCMWKESVQSFPTSQIAKYPGPGLWRYNVVRVKCGGSQWEEDFKSIALSSLEKKWDIKLKNKFI